MNAITLNRQTVRSSNLQSQSGLMGMIRSYLARSSAERQLRQLDDRLLADIGLKRHDIAGAVWGK